MFMTFCCYFLLYKIVIIYIRKENFLVVILITYRLQVIGQSLTCVYMMCFVCP